MQLPPHPQTIVERLVAAGQADERVRAVVLLGSHAKGTADAYSDLDLALLISDIAFTDFVAEREAFLKQLGELVFLENFNLPEVSFYIFADGVEGELYIGRESQLMQLFNEPYQVLLDKTERLTGAVSPAQRPASANPTETLRRQIYYFWHELSHFITALGRGQWWWAAGQLEALRAICINLARLDHDFADPEVGDEPYFKIESVMPVERLAALQSTFAPLDRDAMLRAVHVILRFYQELAQSLAQAHGLAYPAKLERVMVERVERLQDAQSNPPMQIMS
jgi:predicted nucleotidyltransferase